MATRPTDELLWGGTQVDPGEANKTAGYSPGDEPPAEWENYWKALTAEWVGYLRDLQEQYGFEYVIVWGPQGTSWAASQNLELEKGKARLLSGSNTSGLILAPGVAVSPAPFPCLRLRHLNASTSADILVTTDDSAGTDYLSAADLDALEISMEWRSYFTVAGANQLDTVAGFHSDPPTANVDDPATDSLITFRKLHGDTNWQARAGNASSGVTHDTGIAPVANTWQKFKVEYFGEDTPVGTAAGGAVARWYIDGQQVAEDVGSPLPTGSTGLGWMLRFDSTATGPAADTDMVVDPVRLSVRMA